MKNKAILFISDIHYTQEPSRTQFSKDDRNTYYQKWENYLVGLENENDIKFKYLVITGDITDTAKKLEYAAVKDMLEALCSKFNIEKRNILMLPGNHDINRSKLENYCDEQGIEPEKSSEQFEIKLQNFVDFYKEFLNVEDLDVSKSILNSIAITESNLTIMGLNSLVKESFLRKDHIGFVDINKLKAELYEIQKQGKGNIFVATHHSFTTTGNRELATLQNAEILKETLGTFGINTYIYGHHHTSESKLDIIGDYGEVNRYVELGSIGKILKNENGESYTNRFSIAICEENELDLRDFAYTANEWEEINNKKYVHKLKVAQKNITGATRKSQILPMTDEEEIEGNNSIKADQVVVLEEGTFLIEYLKRESSYKEGHFHWKDGCKTLGWINIAAFLGNMGVLNNVKECIIEMHKKNLGDIQVVIGYGMEGNIIGSSLLDYWIENDIKYYFYPSVHKKDEHIDMEKTLWNEYNDFQKVLLICDIMPTKAYLEEIIESNERLNKVTDLCVLSLFYNENLLKEDFEIVSDKRVNIRKISLAKFNVQICEKDEKECLICKENIKKVYTL